MIPVTKPFMPPEKEYIKLLDGIWEREWITNNGPLVQQLERSLKKFLGVRNLQVVSNGTIALQLAINALNLKGEVITTPYTYVATATSIIWEQCHPVFVDISPDNLSLDPVKIEEAINENTSAILATHVYGIPSNTEGIEEIAEKYGLKVIYDAAHAFGVNWKGKSLTSYGDISTLSFHATKVFHTVEGGAVVAGDSKIDDYIFLSKAFGHRGDTHLYPGINGKMSELHAAMGLCVLEAFKNITKERERRWRVYEMELKDIVQTIRIPRDIEYNYGYFPVFLENEQTVLTVQKKLRSLNIDSRRYFFPSLNTLPYIVSDFPCPVSEFYAKRALALPLYHDLGLEWIEKIINIVKLHL